MFRIENAHGQFWTGDCWGVIQAALTVDELDLDYLTLDVDCCPENFFNHALDDIGWGLEDGTIFARAVQVD